MKKILFYLCVLIYILGCASLSYADYNGTIGTRFIINGTGFGNAKSNVYLQNGKNKVQAKIESWSDTSITCLWTNKMSPGTYPLFVLPKGKKVVPIFSGNFTIMKPVIDQATPNNVSAGIVITVNGWYFTNKKPNIYLEDPIKFKRKSCKVLYSLMDPLTGSSTLQFVIPKWGLPNYNLILINTIGQATLAFPHCSYSISPTSQTFDASGGTGKIDVTTENGCNLTATSNNQWIAITALENAAVGGVGHVYYSVSSNPDTIQRNGSISVAGQIFIVQQGADTILPTVTSFSIPANATSLTVSITSFTASDTGGSGLAGYMITETPVRPAAGAAGWSATAPTSYTFESAGSKTIYAWAKDGAGNVSSSLIASVTITIPIRLPKTGQTTSYYPGDDGDLEKGVNWPNPRFTVNADCVTDNLTGLIWSKNANLPTGTKTWQQALDYIAYMNSSSGLCGYHDWRLPNRQELRSLGDYSKYNYNLPPFNNVQISYYWSSTTDEYYTERAWAVDMWDYTIYNLDKSTANAYWNFYVWPVRAGQSYAPAQLPKTGQTRCYNASGTEVNCTGTGQDGEIKAGVAWPNPRFTPVGDCVTDNLTDLIWARNGDLPNGTKTWQQALDYVAYMNSSSGLCGYHDWRLPNVNELYSLLNAEQGNTGMWLNGQGFNNVKSENYWSSTTRANHADLAWGVYLFVGYVNDLYKTNPLYVWPVRGGQ
jgi:hypothetical protein